MKQDPPAGGASGGSTATAATARTAAAARTAAMTLRTVWSSTGPPVGTGSGMQQDQQRRARRGSVTMVITQPKYTKKHVKLKGSKYNGQLLIWRAANWDLIG